MSAPTEPPDLPDLMTLAHVLARLKGVIGRTALLQHLQGVPVFNGGPTHGRLGRTVPADLKRPHKTDADHRRYVFTPDQYRRLIASLAAPPLGVPPAAVPALPSADRAYERVLALTAPRAPLRAPLAAPSEAAATQRAQKLIAKLTTPPGKPVRHGRRP